MDKYLNDFLNYLEVSGKKKKTLAAYKGDLSQFFRSLSNKNALAISASDIRAYLLDQRRKKWKKNTTMTRKIVALKRFFKFLQEENYRQDNPAKSLKYLPTTREEVDIYTPGELKKILQMARGFSLEHQIYIRIFMESGLRPSEVCEIRREDLLLSKGKIYLSPAKIKSSRVAKVVFLSDKLMILLKKYLITKPRKMNDHLFQYRGEPRTQDKVWKMVSKITDFALPYKNYKRERGPNILRHTYITMAKMNGVDLLAIQRSAGWTSLNQLQNYLHLDEKFYKEEDKKFKKRMKKTLNL